MSKFVSSDNDAGESSGVFHDGHAVHLLEPLVDDAGAADVCEAGSSTVAFAVTTLPATHVQPETVKHWFHHLEVILSSPNLLLNI